jgi:hypothetical protein
VMLGEVCIRRSARHRKNAAAASAAGTRAKG